MQSLRKTLCRARQTLPNLTDGLEEAGIFFITHNLYEVVVPSYDPAIVRRIFTKPFDVVIHTSPSSVANLRQILTEAGSILDEKTHFACLGKETASALRRFGMEPWLVPDEPDIESLLDLILNKVIQMP